MSRSVQLHGKQVGRWKASWILFKETFRFLRLDPEMMWLPLLTGLANLLLLGLLFSLGFMLELTYNFSEQAPATQEFLMYGFLFVCYVIGAFTLAISQAGIAHIVYTRVMGGDATLGQGIKQALSHWSSLLVWSLITSTVGLILRIISERSQLLGKLVAWLLGAAWAILTYFVVPAMVIDRQSAFRSIKTSVHVFKRTWGETFVSNITLGLTFLIAHVLVLLSLGGLTLWTISAELWPLAIGFMVLYGIWILAAGLLASSLNGVLKTLLYIYAANDVVPENFDRELLGKVLATEEEGTSSSQKSTQTTTDPVTNYQSH